MDHYDKTHYTGLSERQVNESREKNGVNIITPAKKESVWHLLLDKFNDPIIKILLVAAALSLIVGIMEGEYAETIGIFCAIFLATGVSFWFEYDARRRFEILNVVNDDTPVKVIRDASVTEIPKKDVVVGDIALLASGDEIPADGKLLETVSLKVNESTLTGETSAFKTTDPSKFPDDTTYPPDIAMKGTTVIEGNGVMEITAVGDSTEYGKVAEQSTVENDLKTPLNIQLIKLSRLIGKIGGAVAILVFLIQISRGIWFGGELLHGDWLHIASTLLGYFMVSVVIMVMAVPEGLPMSITLSLAINMRRMLKTNNLVRRMHACETMGAVTVICTDKTGTLTRNQMKVEEIQCYGDLPDGELARMIAQNSSAFLDKEGKVIGNPTEGALLMWMNENGCDYRSLRDEANIVDRMPFTTERKFMATLISGEDGKNELLVKGAPEIVQSMCGNKGDEISVTETLKGYQNRAMRTLGFAVAFTDAGTCEQALESGKLELVAIAAIADPVREDVPDAVARCLDAGIDVKIVTGDTPATATEIARQIGLWNDSRDQGINIITGPEFGEMTDEELRGRIHDLKIMARARPLDKQRLVKLLQEAGEVVAVTGDGTNDAPALNFAQVGLSMGSGTSVAKEASDITLLDDSFRSIATAVMWGRSLYRNIQRFVMFQLTVNFVALVVVFFGSIFGGELPLTITQILWVNIIMDTFAAMALASLPPEEGVMSEKPRKETDFIITKPMSRRIFGWGAVFIVTLLGLLLWWGSEVTVYQLTAFFTVFVLFQFWNLFNARRYKSYGYNGMKIGGNLGFYGIILAILVGQVIIVTFGGEVFRAEPLGILHWLYIIAGTSVVAIAGLLVERRPKAHSRPDGDEKQLINA